MTNPIWGLIKNRYKPFFIYFKRKYFYNEIEAEVKRVLIFILFCLVLLVCPSQAFGQNIDFEYEVYGSGTIEISWEEIEGIESFEVWWDKTSRSYTNKVDVDKANTYLIGQTDPNTYYYVVLVGVKTDGETVLSDEIPIKTPKATESDDSLFFWILWGVFVVCGVLVLWFVLRRKRRRTGATRETHESSPSKSIDSMSRK